ncbi:SpoIIE family protein phosphatase [Kitasatospora sp. NPDC054939]
MSEPSATDAAFVRALFAHSPVGLFVLDTDLRVVRYNRAARGLRDLPEGDVLGHTVTDFAPGVDAGELTALARRVLADGEPVRSRLLRWHRPADPPRAAALSVSLFRLESPVGRILGLAALVEDVTAREEAQSRLAVLADAHRNIGTTLNEATTAEELAAVAVPAFADGIVVDLLTETVQGRQLRHGRSGRDAVFQRAALRDVDGRHHASQVEPGTLFGLPPHTPFTQSLADLRPRLITRLDPDAPWLAADPERARRLAERGIHTLIATPLAVHDTVLGLAVFIRHRRADPFDAGDLQLAEELASRTALSLAKAHAYTRERTLATALQRRLLPSRPPEVSAVDTACLHLGGDDGADWFDIVPLSGTRVALTVGTVGGRGIEAAATMGQLRVAVRTLAAQDPAPAELLAALDDATEHLAAEPAAAPGPEDPADADGIGGPADLAGPEAGEVRDADASADPAAVVSATCLYLVYDPLSRRCTAASAGHPAPLLSGPDGRPIDLPLRVGPPLGRGGGYEAASVELPEGSLIALPTTGLLHARGRSEHDARRLLHEVLARPDRDLAALCDDAAYAVQPAASEDDASLLLGRTRTLAADRVAVWTLPDDPAAVSKARSLAAQQLAEWQLHDLVETTRLIVSELVTNAIRYGAAPITLRLIRDRELICEVSDNSSTAPHMRQAEETDEGGRGLFLVMSLSHRWGTRFRARGKTIWSTQAVPTP